jgi:hypothetical protein
MTLFPAWMPFYDGANRKMKVMRNAKKRNAEDLFVRIEKSKAKGDTERYSRRCIIFEGT